MVTQRLRVPFDAVRLGLAELDGGADLGDLHGVRNLCLG